MRCIRVGSLLPLVGVALTVGGCAVGNTHTFRYLPPEAEELGHGRVVLVFDVREARPAVVEEGEPSTWVGEQRSGLGIPYNVLTTDGKALTRIVRETIEKDLEAVGFEVEVSSSEAGSSAQEVAQRIREASAERGLFVEVREFNSNTYTNIDMEWDLIARVFGPSGAVLGENRLEGRTTLDGSFMNPPRAAKRSVPPFFYDLMRQLVTENDEVMRALTGSTEEAASGTATNGCTVEQVLSMQRSGLTESQIRAACEANEDGR